jgi:hypothetical protein
MLVGTYSTGSRLVKYTRARSPLLSRNQPAA